MRYLAAFYYRAALVFYRGVGRLLRHPRTVERWVYWHPQYDTFLQEVRRKTTEYFGECRLGLRIAERWETCHSEEDELIIEIYTQLDGEEGVTAIERFDNEYWFKSKQFHSPIFIWALKRGEYSIVSDEVSQ